MASVPQQSAQVDPIRELLAEIEARLTRPTSPLRLDDTERQILASMVREAAELRLGDDVGRLFADESDVRKCFRCGQPLDWCEDTLCRTCEIGLDSTKGGA